MNWWSLRVTYLYQQLFEERSATLTNLAYEYIEKREPLSYFMLTSYFDYTYWDVKQFLLVTKMFESTEAETLANHKYNKTIVGYPDVF